jgi:glycosyltransferase involved in cell wall biosynthesis
LPVLKVSAIVPVYNPGEHIDRCIESLVGQSLPADEYEVIFVDDGSTDGTGARLDALAAEHPHVRVEHIPNSGWPGKPRNVGIEMARGEFVYFVDNDDYVGREALERLYDRALETGADVVMGKVVGRGKYVPRAIFRKNRNKVTLAWPPLLQLLTPHKLYRKALLDERGIRFPEGRRRLEDHLFTMQAYFAAERIAVLADYPCYYWWLRPETSASYEQFDEKQYYENLREVLDLVVENTEPGPERDRLLAHWYRGKMLGRVGGRWFPNRTPERRRALYDEVRRLADERYGPEVDSWLAPNLRVRSHLLREGTFEQLSALGLWEGELRADATVTEERRDPDGVFVMTLEGRLLAKGDTPLLFERRGDRLMWVPPEELRGMLPDGVLDMTAALPRAKMRTIIRLPWNKTEFVVPGRHELVLAPAPDGLVTPVVRTEARIDPATAAGGSKPRMGHWEVLAAVTVCGFAVTGRVRSKRTAAAYELAIDSGGNVLSRRGAILSAVKGKAARAVPGLARLARRAQERRAAASH